MITRQDLLNFVVTRPLTFIVILLSATTVISTIAVIAFRKMGLL